MGSFPENLVNEFLELTEKKNLDDYELLVYNIISNKDFANYFYVNVNFDNFKKNKPEIFLILNTLKETWKSHISLSDMFFKIFVFCEFEKIKNISQKIFYNGEVLISQQFIKLVDKLFFI